MSAFGNRLCVEELRRPDAILTPARGQGPPDSHPADPLPADVTSEHRTEPVPPVPHGLMANVDPPRAANPPLEKFLIIT
jgi:hypothetical protein